ncbi:MAG TPA: helix-turn-helix domain-containing protein [Blastocatellia bacterium]|nr:helix-turn-helix domain-containing protein [Blastocatellia bacterium]
MRLERQRRATRELRNPIERAVILASSEEITPDDLPIELRTNVRLSPASNNGDDHQPGSLDELKKKQIINVLEQTGWQGKASEILGISPSTTLSPVEVLRSDADEENARTRDVRAYGLSTQGGEFAPSLS